MSTGNNLAEVERAIREGLKEIVHLPANTDAQVAFVLAGYVKPVISRLLAQGWKCFFCDEIFTDRHEAYLHFGEEARELLALTPKRVRLLRELEVARATEEEGEWWGLSMQEADRISLSRTERDRLIKNHDRVADLEAKLVALQSRK